MDPAQRGGEIRSLACAFRERVQIDASVVSEFDEAAEPSGVKLLWFRVISLIRSEIRPNVLCGMDRFDSFRDYETVETSPAGPTVVLLLQKISPYVLLLVFAGLCFFSQIDKSVTVDEFCHLPSGIYNLLTSDWRMDGESPPLIKGFLAVGAIAANPQVNVTAFRADPNPWSFGYDFMFRNERNYHRIFVLGRCVVIAIACLGGLLLFKFASQIFGYRAGLFGLFLYVFNPNVIAHARLATIDMGATCVMLLGIYCFWRFLKAPSAKAATIGGVALGFVQLSKFTGLIFYPIYLLIDLLSLTRTYVRGEGGANSGKDPLLKHAGYMVLMFSISVLVINMGYSFSRSLVPLDQYHFQSRILRELGAFLPSSLPVPVPFDYARGFDAQLFISEGRDPFYEGYLLGQRSLNGWWYYYIIAFFVKNPVSLCALWIYAGFVWIREKGIRPDFETSLCIGVPVLAFLLYFSLFTRTPMGVRWLLPIFPLCFLAAGIVCESSLFKGMTKKGVAACFAAAYLIPAAAAFPDYLAYFNFAIGGPKKGHEWLIDSNLDWGQDLPGLRKYMEKNGIERIALGYFGRVDPGIYGVNYTVAGRDVEPGPCAMSINFLVGRPYYLLDRNRKKLTYIDRDYFKAYRRLSPVAKIGHSLHIFDIKEAQLQGDTHSRVR